MTAHVKSASVFHITAWYAYAFISMEIKRVKWKIKITH